MLYRIWKPYLLNRQNRGLRRCKAVLNFQLRKSYEYLGVRSFSESVREIAPLEGRNWLHGRRHAPLGG